MFIKKSYVKTVIAYFAIILLLSGCLTKKLWEDTYVETYEETIDALLINPKNDSLIFLGEKYHYIMQPDEKFSYLYNHLNKNMYFQIDKGTYLLKDNNIKASFSVFLKYDEKTKQWMENKGYIKKGETSYKKDYIDIELKGKRYKADKKVNQVAKKLPRTYTIDIKATKSNLPTVLKVPLTPLSVAGDAILTAYVTVVAVPTYLFFISR